jgi:hypothetical protein
MEPEAKRLNDLFNAAKRALLALPVDSLVQPRVSRDRAALLTTILKHEYSSLQPLLSVELSAERVAEREADLDSIGTHSLVYYAAELLLEGPWTSDQKARKAELASKVREHDRYLSRWAVAVFDTNADAKKIVASILRGRGRRDDADDTIQLGQLFRHHWDEVAGKTPVTTAHIEAAEADAAELLQILDAGKVAPMGSPRDMRKRAYTVWHRAYSELFHLGRYLRRDDPEAAARILAITPERGSVDANEEPEPAAPGPT